MKGPTTEETAIFLEIFLKNYCGLLLKGGAEPESLSYHYAKDDRVSYKLDRPSTFKVIQNLLISVLNANKAIYSL